MPSQHTEIPEEKPHYSYVTRSILRLMKMGALTNVTSVDVEPNYGRVARLTYTNGLHRITYTNNLGLNNAAASDLAKDKGFTKFILRTIGVNCPEGDEFILPWWQEMIKEPLENHGVNAMRTIDQAADYITQNMGYPVYMKPVAGSKGSGIFLIHNQTELDMAANLYNENHTRLAMIETPIKMPDYRVVILDGELISAYRRVPLQVIGDGTSTIKELIVGLQKQFFSEGRDTRLDPEDSRITNYLAQHDMTILDVPKKGQALTLMAISNLSAGGTSEDVTDKIHKKWVDLAIKIGENFNLRLVGVDLACEDITSPDAEYSVIEVNSSPGLDHFALSGETQKELVDQLYTKVLNALPSHT